MKPKLLITRQLKPETLAPLQEHFTLDVWESEDTVMPRAELLARSKGAVGVLCMLTDKIDEEFLNAAGEQLRAVSTMSVGFDHIDTKALEARNIQLGITPGVLDNAVADLTIALMLNASRRIPEAIQAAKTGKWGTWSPYWMTGQDLSNATVGIVGMGAIGAMVTKRLSGFGCNFVYQSIAKT